MITKKLAVPLVNEKILQQAVHCYVATSSLSDEGFEFLRSRLAPSCKIDLVTGFEGMPSPSVFQKILKHYQGRISVRAYTKNVLHANLFIFDLPFRKSVAFLGSGALTLEGLKDHEELFWKVTDPKQVESVLSWYTSYFQFGVPVTEAIVEQYSAMYATLAARNAQTVRDLGEFVAAAGGAFNLDTIRFRDQYFVKEDYELLTLTNAYADNASLRLRRQALAEKVAKMGVAMKPPAGLRLVPDDDAGSIDPKVHPGEKISSLWSTFAMRDSQTVVFQAGITQSSVAVRALILQGGERAGIFATLRNPDTSAAFYRKLTAGSPPCRVEVMGVERRVDSFPNEKSLEAFLATDPGNFYRIVFTRSFPAGDAVLKGDSIAVAMEKLLTEFFDVFGVLRK